MKTLVVQNFGPVKDASLELKDINLFIGEQSIGKSTLAKLITILTDHISLLAIIKNGISDWNKRLHRYNLGVYKDDDYKILYEMHDEDFSFHFEIISGILSLYIVIDGNKITDKDLIFESIAGSKKIYHDAAVKKYIELLENDDDKKNKAFVNLMNNSLYIPAERIIYTIIRNLMPALSLAKSSIPWNLLKFMVELENAKSEYPEMDMPILGISYKQENSDDFFVVNSNGLKLPVVAASSGIQSTMPLLQVIHYAINHKEYSTFVIEEPECNLFPEKQVELLEYILKKIKGEDRTLTITTHSPYILSAMNNFLFAGSIVKNLNGSSEKTILDTLGDKTYILPDECSVYSIGESINGDGKYCKSLMDEQTGMIDYNTLDIISSKLSAEFEELSDIFIQKLKN